MKIYTRAGDKGKTQVIGHEVMYKSNKRVVSYGTIDELNSLVGQTRANLSKANKGLDEELEEIQQILFDCGHDLAISSKKEGIPFMITKELGYVAKLEDLIDKYTEPLPKIKKFILPAGSPTAAALQVDRTVTRRAERTIVDLMQGEPVNDEVLRFINRLSDYFFTVARYANLNDNGTETLYRNSKNIFR
ncbi:cob(I)yrinic acid a,c-diamide adenosyltransferase [Pediococcus claussenii]|uniref:Corrinoid adenosyltransferase n=1 Tax=Pediococcus claussenii (strain ATCC BAA-344 / DSM 14800 / JCM 18046 / KCTC 3811 / LMG 21948 / P06) TaxID=701521 RepID=G8PEM1_PEDCP|nr:cob(I)yrinic acid a,c-diamide adenosyltransferase [Pediococcus claussenii]AEV95630.1 cob(I)yrinic acid a,c-diamide adenosyltransferase [Pediococcus claussenii ATCC BAA-344]ANZ69150.1 cobalamin adenosyltransferase [Pediococcus claussenii]ANZ70967.1 cobalamin adenosyltransferase [Pediococcus claussenii]KRN20137.1 hypothetical protein IV79_GL000802 [Pediococcus claussenii]